MHLIKISINVPPMTPPTPATVLGSFTACPCCPPSGFINTWHGEKPLPCGQHGGTLLYQGDAENGGRNSWVPSLTTRVLPQDATEECQHKDTHARDTRKHIKHIISHAGHTHTHSLVFSLLLPRRTRGGGRRRHGETTSASNQLIKRISNSKT